MRGSRPEQTGWRSVRFVAVDLETTGLDPARDELISFAAVPIQDGRVRPGELVTTLLRPQRFPGPDTIRIHGLRPSDLCDQPPLEERIDLICETLAGAVLVAHCAWIERGFLSAALGQADRGFDCQVIDTMTLGAVVLREADIPCPPDPSLSFLAQALNLPVHRPHHADGDALTTAQVFLALASLYRRDHDATVAELARAGRSGFLRSMFPRPRASRPFAHSSPASTR